MSNTVILNSDRLPAQMGRHINGPMRFQVFAESKKPAQRKGNGPQTLTEPRALKGVWLRKGPNHNITDEQVEQLKQNPHAATFLEQGVIEIVKPLPAAEGTDLTGHSKEYKDHEIRRIIAETDDIDWLNESRLTEHRADIRNAIASRLKTLEQIEAKARANASAEVQPA